MNFKPPDSKVICLCVGCEFVRFLICWLRDLIGPFIQGKIRRVLHKTHLKQDTTWTIYTSMSYLTRKQLV